MGMFCIQWKASPSAAIQSTEWAVEHQHSSYVQEGCTKPYYDTHYVFYVMFSQSYCLNTYSFGWSLLLLMICAYFDLLLRANNIIAATTRIIKTPPTTQTTITIIVVSRLRLSSGRMAGSCATGTITVGSELFFSSSQLSSPAIVMSAHIDSI